MRDNTAITSGEKVKLLLAVGRAKLIFFSSFFYERKLIVAGGMGLVEAYNT